MTFAKGRLLPVVLLTATILTGLSSPIVAAPTVKNGAIDLSSWDFDQEGGLDLKGQWRFYPQRFIEPHQVTTELLTQGHPTQVPGSWATDTQWQNEQDKIGQNSWGTYLVKLENIPQLEDPLGLNLRADTAAEVIVVPVGNPEASDTIIRLGQPGNSEANSTPQIGEPLGIAQMEAGHDYYLMVHISNFHWHNGGIWAAPTLDRHAHLLRQRTNSWLSDLFIIGMIFIMTIYNFSLFLQRREDYASLFLAGHAACILLRGIATSCLIYQLFPEPNAWVYEIARKCELGFTNLSTALIISFFIASFRSNKHPLYLKGYHAFSIIVLLFTIATTVNLYGQVLWIYQIPILVMIIPPTVIAIRSAIKGIPGATMSAIGIAAVILTALHDIAMGMGLFFSTLFLSPYGLAILNFTQGQVIAIMFAKAFRTAEKLSRELKQEVARQTRDIRSMLDHIPEGIFTIVPPGVIHANYSAQLEKIFETKDIANRNAVDFIFSRSNLNSDQKSRIETTVLTTLGEPTFCFESNANHLAKEIDMELDERRTKHLELSWNPIEDQNDVTEKILVTMRDVTTVKDLEKQNINQRKELEYITEIVNIPKDKFDQFIEMAHNFIEENQRLIDKNKEKSAEVLKIMFINMHTIKGTARSYRFNKMTGILHEVEQSYAHLLKDPNASWNRDELNSDLNQARSIVNVYDTLSTQKLGRSKNNGNRISVEREFLEQKIKSIEKIDFSGLSSNDLAVIHECLQSFDEVCYDRAIDVFEDILQLTEKLAKDLGKEVPTIQVEDPGFRINYEAQQLFRNTFVHIVRNSLDHGIETAKERIDKGKNPTGSIKVIMTQQDQFMVIKYYDDGKGLDLEGLYQTAVKRGLIEDSQELTPQETAELMFHAGLSTCAAVSDISGRGVGMDAVRKYVNQKGGFIKIILTESTDQRRYRAFKFELGIPEKLFTFSRAEWPHDDVG
jgi:HPt (histidine-containing phosphotransfer) domain-containing protein